MEATMRQVQHVRVDPFDSSVDWFEVPDMDVKLAGQEGRVVQFKREGPATLIRPYDRGDKVGEGWTLGRIVQLGQAREVEDLPTSVDRPAPSGSPDPLDKAVAALERIAAALELIALQQKP